MIIGYARTSTTDQTAGLGAQERDLKAAGAEKIFAEQTSSVAQRTVLRTCLDFVREGDVLMVTKPDRLARSTQGLHTIEAELAKRGVGLIVLSMGGEKLDTRNPTSKLMLTILAGVATWEREIMLERQREGIAKAKSEGRYKGRPPSIDATEVKRMKDAGIGPAAIAKQLASLEERLPTIGRSASRMMGVRCSGVELRWCSNPDRPVTHNQKENSRQ